MRRRNAPTNRPAMEPPTTMARRGWDLSIISMHPLSTLADEASVWISGAQAIGLRGLATGPRGFRLGARPALPTAAPGLTHASASCRTVPLGASMRSSASSAYCEAGLIVSSHFQDIGNGIGRSPTTVWTILSPSSIWSSGKSVTHSSAVFIAYHHSIDLVAMAEVVAGPSQPVYLRQLTTC